MTEVRAGFLSIAEAATELDLTADTLRYYERDRLLLAPVGRSASGHRRYSADDIRWLRLVTRLRSTGMAIRDVRRYADLVRAGASNEVERLDLLEGPRAPVLAQLAEVQQDLGAINHKIGIYTDAVEQRGVGAA
ncbi:MerR family transcriptional regulator [soil metagenome]